jgi:exodeoxyribonuclease VII small subunit
MTDRTPGDPDAPDAIGYADALAELERILDELDGDEVDVDVLGSRVRRAAELLRLCRDRISAARFEVEQVVAELESDATTPLGGAAAVPDGSDLDDHGRTGDDHEDEDDGDS